MSKRRGAAPKEQQREHSHHLSRSSLLSSISSSLNLFARGLLQAPRLDLALASVSRSSEAARAAALQCFCLNGLVFVSLLAWRWVVAPAAAAAAAAGKGRIQSFPLLLSSLAAAFFAPRTDPNSPPLELTAAFILGWVFPASALALSLSGPWCLAVAKGVYADSGRGNETSRRGKSGGGSSGRSSRSRSRSRTRAANRSSSTAPRARGALSLPTPPAATRRKKSSSSSSSAAAAAAATAAAEAAALELYRGTLFSLLWAQAGLSRFVPFLRVLGPLISTLLTWLLYGLMAFDYRFTAESESRKSTMNDDAAAGAENDKNDESDRVLIGVADRVAAFGRAWPYYMAFGVVAASPSLVLPFWEGMAAVAAVYPLFVALAASGNAAAPAEEDDFSPSSRGVEAAATGFSLLSFVFAPAIMVTDLVVSKLTPFAWRVVGRVVRLASRGGGGRGGSGERAGQRK